MLTSEWILANMQLHCSSSPLLEKDMIAYWYYLNKKKKTQSKIQIYQSPDKMTVKRKPVVSKAPLT